MSSFIFSGLIFYILVSVLSETNANQRIVGGAETTIDEVPYQVSLQYVIEDTHSHSCGATIISTKLLLTAASCHPGNKLDIFYARVGSTMYDRGGQLLKVGAFIPHSSYNKETFDYNFAIVSFANNEQITIGTNAAIVTLATPDSMDPADTSMVSVSGWGITFENGGVTPFNLRKVNLPMYNRIVCKSTYGNLTDRQMCIGGTNEGGTGACTFDTGGPAIQNGILYGVFSNAKSCELPNVPGVYGRVASIRQWIKDFTGV